MLGIACSESGCLLLRAPLGAVSTARSTAEARPNVSGDSVEIAPHCDRPAHLVYALSIGLIPLCGGVPAIVVESSVVAVRELATYLRSSCNQRSGTKSIQTCAGGAVAVTGVLRIILEHD